MRCFSNSYKYDKVNRTLSLLAMASLVAQSVKNLPAVQESRVWSLGWEDPLEKEMATHSSILAWEISWTEEPGGLQSMESQESDIMQWLKNNNNKNATLRVLFRQYPTEVKLPPSCLQVNMHFDPDMEAVGKWQIKERHWKLLSYDSQCFRAQDNGRNKIILSILQGFLWSVVFKNALRGKKGIHGVKYSCIV